MSSIEVGGRVRLVLWRHQVQPDLAVLVDDSTIKLAEKSSLITLTYVNLQA